MSSDSIVVEYKRGRAYYRYKQSVWSWIIRTSVMAPMAMALGLTMEVVMSALTAVLFPGVYEWLRSDIRIMIVEFLFFHILAWILLRREVRWMVLGIGID